MGVSTTGQRSGILAASNLGSRCCLSPFRTLGSLECPAVDQAVELPTSTSTTELSFTIWQIMRKTGVYLYCAGVPCDHALANQSTMIISVDQGPGSTREEELRLMTKDASGAVGDMFKELVRRFRRQT